ncbi:MAG: RNA polymerase sigma factor [Patescibacteria group bacterium]
MDTLKQEFSKIYDEYIKKIYRFIYLKVSSEAIAQDLTSETFLKFWKSFQKRGSDIDNSSAFLYKIAHNLIVDHYKKREKQPSISIEDKQIADQNVNLEKGAILSSDMDTVKTVLADINSDYQDIIIWHYLDEFSIPEIALMMDKSEETARVTLHRALKSLKEKMEQNRTA